MDDWVKVVAGLIVGVIGLLSLGFNVYQYFAARRRESLDAIIRGDKETAAAAAARILNMERRARRGELEALCLAAVFERSGRTRSLIHEALKSQQGLDRTTIAHIVDQITVVVARNASYTDLGLARRRLVALRAALSLDGDSRTRVDSMEIFTDAATRGGGNPCGCDHEAHRWSEFRESLSLLGTLVLVCSTEHVPGRLDRPRPPLGAPIIALDYHRTASGTLSITGQTLVDEKYADPPIGVDGGLEAIAQKLSLIILHNERYSSADAIAAIPGTEHRYSEHLGNRLSQITHKPLVAMSAVKDPERHFVVDDGLTGLPSVILVDDVFRTGRTFRDGESCLVAAGTKQVLGLVATSTISSTEAPCPH